MSNTQKDMWIIRAVIAAGVICFGIAAVVLLTLANDPTSNLVALLIAVLPATIAAIMGMRQQNRHGRQIDEIAERTNGPLTKIAGQVQELRDEIIGDDKR